MIYDLQGNRIYSFNFALVSGGAENISLAIDCRAGYSLACVPIENVAVEARLPGAPVWVNLETEAIDLSPHAGTRQQFDFRFTAASGITSTITQTAQIKVA